MHEPDGVPTALVLALLDPCIYRFVSDLIAVALQSCYRPDSQTPSRADIATC